MVCELAANFGFLCFSSVPSNEKVTNISSYIVYIRHIACMELAYLDYNVLVRTSICVCVLVVMVNTQVRERGYECEKCG